MNYNEKIQKIKEIYADFKLKLLDIFNRKKSLIKKSPKRKLFAV